MASPRARPYVVVQFEQSEFVSREPIPESDAPVRGVPLSRVNSALNLNVSGVARTLTTPTSSSSGSSDGHLTAHNPVWKHEVDL